jgi:hypothetical protein
MLLAWDAKRAEPARDFADCLRGAWAFARRMADYAAKFMRRSRKHGGRVQFSHSVIRSPIERAVALEVRPRVADFKAAYTTARFGG